MEKQRNCEKSIKSSHTIIKINNGILKKGFIFLVGIVIFVLPCYFYVQVINSSKENLVTELSIHEIHEEELVQLFDPPPFTFNLYNFSIIQSSEELCHSSVDILFVVVSAPQNLKARNAIRQTWGSVISAHRYQVAFLVASSESEKTNEMLSQESVLFNDIVQADFLDSYYNLTLKSILMLRWIYESCNNVKRFIVKTDDDTFVNVPLLLLKTKHWVPNDFRKRIYGNLVRKSSPHRNPKSKWYVSETQYAEQVYPDFVFGPMYILTPDSVPKLYSTALETPYLYLEDVFLTGIVAKKAHITRFHLPDVLNSRGSKHGCDYRKYIAFHYIPPSEMYKIWATLNDGSLSKCAGEPSVDLFEKVFINFKDKKNR